MATITKTWTFDSDAQGFSLGRWSGAQGDPAVGALAFTASKSDVDGFDTAIDSQQASGTWESWGVPSGQVVKAVTFSANLKFDPATVGGAPLIRVSVDWGEFAGPVVVATLTSTGAWALASGSLVCVPEARSISTNPADVHVEAIQTGEGTAHGFTAYVDNLTMLVTYGDAWTDLCGGGGGPGGGGGDCGDGARPMSDLFAELIVGECLSLCCCLRLTRGDGTVQGFTSLDQDLTFDTVSYQAADGMGISTLRTKVGTGVDNLQITGLQVEDRVVEADMRAGRYDGAKILLFALDYERLEAGAIILLTGTVGAIGFSDGGFEFEARSLAQRLAQNIGDLYSPLCRAILGDAQCGVDLAAFTFTRTVSGVPTRENMAFDGDTHATDYYAYGLVTFTSGANVGISRPVRTHENSGGMALISVQEPFPFNVAAGDTADLQAGCDRKFSTCRTKFSNAANFRGEPHVPRADTLITVTRTS